MKSTSGTPLLTRPILYFLATMILANIAGNMGRPLLPLYLQSLGANVTQIGLFFTLSAVAPLVFQIFGGWLSDIIGRLEAIAVGSIAGTLGWVVWAIAPTWQLMLPGMILAAMAVSFVAPSFDAFVAEQSSEENRGRVYGLVLAAFTIVSVIGPPLGGYIAEGLSFRTLFVVAGIIYGLAALGRVAMAIAARRSRPRSPRQVTLANLKVSLWEMAGLVLAGGVVTWIFVSDGVRDVSNGLVDQMMPIYLRNELGMTTIEIGFLIAIMSIVIMALTGPAGWLADRRGERAVISLGFAMHFLAIVVFLISPSFLLMAVSWGIFGVGDALIRPAYQSLISKVVPERLRGTAFGLFTTSIGLIALPAPYIGGLLYDRISPRTPFVVLLGALLVSIPLVWFKFRLPKAVSRLEGETAASQP